MHYKIVKQVLDITMSLIGLVILIPIFTLIIVILFVTNQGEPFFTQNRSGKNHKIFRVIKFRTMNNKRDINGNLLNDKERLTPIGLFLRKLSLDELPQLINVLKGEMSLIGPRPLLTQYLTLYSKEQLRRHDVKPGITGWAQIHGRNAISWQQKFEYDVWYVENLSFALDMKILWKTTYKIFRKEGISQPGQATMEFFTGNE